MLAWIVIRICIGKEKRFTFLFEYAILYEQKNKNGVLARERIRRIEVEFYIAQGISVVTAIIAACTMQLKNLKMILLGQLTTNLLVAFSYILLGGLSGGGICLIAVVQSTVMFFYNQKKKKPQWWVLSLFIAAYVACSIVYYDVFIDIFPAIAAVCFSISIAMRTPFLSRLWFIFNPILWAIYDISTLAFGNFLIHMVVFGSTAIALIRVDDIFGLKKCKKVERQESGNETIDET